MVVCLNEHDIVFLSIRFKFFRVIILSSCCLMKMMLRDDAFIG